MEANDNMTNIMNVNNTLYLLYRNVYPCWPLIISAIAINLVAIFGMVANFGVIWTTFRTKSLHGTANVLLALCSFFELLHQHGHFLFLYVALSGHNFIPLSLAIKICAISLFAVSGISLIMAFTGVDRLLCVIMPTFPRTVKKIPYLGTIIFVCVCISSHNLLLVFESTSEMPLLMVTGTIGDLLIGYGGQNISSIMFVCNAFTIIVYVIVGFLIRKKSASNNSNAEKFNRRIFRSLFIIILINVSGYYICSAYYMFIVPNLFHEDPIKCWTITMFVAILTVNVSAASNGPVLYVTSTEYRKAFVHEFGLIGRFFCFPNNASSAAIQLQANHLPINVVKVTPILSPKTNVGTKAF
ncbi:hypothetical protein niasHT_034145 [Heterodera trifolii]|uniref:G-protein coupled receptors family 1 profile domain-containing protein n=1 Tax=Heterodera trifolii TaxID=157864 RepID=A0ABD2IAB7_9BILA